MSHKVGIANVGNTCFMNAVFQALRHSPGILEFFWKAFHHYNKKGEAIGKAFYDLITKILAANPPAAFPTLPATVDPRAFVRTFTYVTRTEGGIEYRFGDQLDASEFLQYIMDTIHTYMSYPVIMDITPGSGDNIILSQQTHALEAWKASYEKEYSSILDQFFGQTQNITTCMNCNKKSSEKYEPWCKIEASIPNSNIHGARAPTLLECLEHSFSEEIVEDYNCDSCHVRSSCKKTHRLTRLPTNIIIVLKRFTNTGGKVSGGILWDLENLDLNNHYAFISPFKTPPPSYKTYAVIEHHGRTGGGHYFMRARQGSQWIEYNDSSVREIPKELVITDNSYIIFATSNPSYESFHKTIYPEYKHRAELIVAAATSTVASADINAVASADMNAATSAATSAAATTTAIATNSTDPAPPA